MKVKFKVEKIYRIFTEDGRDIGRFVEDGSFHGYTHLKDPSHAGRSMVVDGMHKDPVSTIFCETFGGEGECEVAKASTLVVQALENKQ